jgi:hypothetical protein
MQHFREFAALLLPSLAGKAQRLLEKLTIFFVNSYFKMQHLKAMAGGTLPLPFPLLIDEKGREYPRSPAPGTGAGAASLRRGRRGAATRALARRALSIPDPRRQRPGGRHRQKRWVRTRVETNKEVKFSRKYTHLFLAWTACGDGRLPYTCACRYTGSIWDHLRKLSLTGLQFSSN